MDIDAELDALFTDPTAVALALVDEALARISGRDLVPTAEMVDLLLDIRRALGPLPAVGPLETT
jgi:hypothetical protein